MEKNNLQTQLPMPIDSKRYFIGSLAFKDLLIITPFLLLSAFLVLLLYGIGMLNTITIVIAFLPFALGMVGQITKHKIRKEITFFEYGILWEIDYKFRIKEFFKKRGVIRKMEDSRSLFLKDTYAGCYETEQYFVKVLEASSINLSLMNVDETKDIIGAFKSFMNTLNITKDIQYLLLAAPVSLNNHINKVEARNVREENPVKRLLNRAYIKSMDSDVQKNRDLVTRKRYIVIRELIGKDREKSLSDITTKAQTIKSKLESLEFGGYESLSINILDNDDLTKLMFTCLDYDSSLSVGEQIVNRVNSNFGVSFGEETAKDIIELLSKELVEKIN